MSLIDCADTTAFEAKEKAEGVAVRVNGSPAVKSKKAALGGSLKRTLDVALALFGLIALSPLYLMVAATVRLTSRGPALYGHSRIGLGGRPFRCWKFRSMVTNGDDVLARYFERCPDARFEWDTNRKLKHDPRVTPFGKVLRAYSIDELPQLLNVLSGDMSLVGPRPVVRDELRSYGTSAELYLQTRPGITGLWQISGRSDVSYAERVSLDTDYVTNWSLTRDCVIIAKTIPAVIAAKGSY